MARGDHFVLDRPRFPTTHWSLIDRAAQGEAGREALAQLLHQYLPALRVHLLRRHRLSVPDADDLLQAFVLDKLILQQVLARAEQGKGRFRTFLLTVLDNYTRNRLSRARKQSVALPCAVSEQAHASPTADQAFDAAWGREVVRQAVETMAAAYDEAGRQREWQLFQRRVLQPTLEQTTAPNYSELVETLGFDTPAQAYNALTTAKRAFQRHLREVIGQYARGADEVETELSELWQSLAQHRA
jgi:RNA polymerase sigma-70 factor (ECF subfamily)